MTSAGNDTFRGANNGDLASNDMIDGGAGNDTINATFTEDAAAAQTVKPLLTSIETINISTTAVANDFTTTLDLGDSTGVKAVNVTVANDFDFTIAGIEASVATTFIGTGTADTEAGVTLKGLSTATDGGADSYTVALNNADLGKLTVNGVETLTVVLSGKDVDVAVLTADALEKLVIAGGVNDASVTTENAVIGSGTAIEFAGLDTPAGGVQETAVIDASASTGEVSVVMSDTASSLQAIGGAGKFILNNTADGADTADNTVVAIQVTAGAGALDVTLQGGGNAADAKATNKVTVTGSAGKDSVNIAAVVDATDITATALINESQLINAIVSTGEGDDTITIDGAAVQLDAGTGDDTVVVTTWASVDKYDKIDLGEGTDTVKTSEATLGASQKATMAFFKNAEVVETTANQAAKVIDIAALGTVSRAVVAAHTAVAAAAADTDASGAADVGTVGSAAVTFTSSNTVGDLTVKAALVGQAGQALADASDDAGDVGGVGGAGLDLNAKLDNGSNSVTVKFTDNADITGGAGGLANGLNAVGGVGGVGIDANEYETLNIILAATDTTKDTVTISGGAGGASANGTAGAKGADIIVGANGVINITETLAAISGTTALTVKDHISSINLGAITGNNVTVNAQTLNGAVTIASVTGNTVINTGAGADNISAGTGVDTINLGAGDDVVDAQTGADLLTLGAGNDIVTLADQDSTEASMKKISDFGLMANAYTASAATDTAAEVASTNVAGTEADILDTSDVTVAANKTASDTGVDIGAATDIQDTITNGILTLSGAGASAVDTLAEWIDQAEAALGNSGAVAFVYDNNTYVVAKDGGGNTDVVIELTGVVAVGLAQVDANSTASIGGAGWVLMA